MKKLAPLTLLTLPMLIFNCIFAQNNESPEENFSDDKDIISGMVKIEKDNLGNITKVAVNCSGKSDSGQDEIVSYLVILDKKGIELGEKFNGKNVEVVGIISRKEKGDDAELWIKVLSFNETKPDSEPED